MNEDLEIRFLGQSGFLLKTPNYAVLIDPRDKTAGKHDGDILYCTHYHSDHTGGVDVFLKRNPDALFICNEQVADRYEQWQDQIRTVEDGEHLTEGDLHFIFTKMRHGLFSGVENYGVEIQFDTFKFGHCGDAKEFGAFAGRALDVLAVPISGVFAASPTKVYDTLEKFDPFPSVIVPMHWLVRRPGSFCKNFHKRFPAQRCVIPEDGEILPI
ncbi:MAG: Hydroxyacylglutathione hydrolase [Candidatus Thorarchaeota archaeon]|nr:MAG: Hydroxyacylglutathione hydrolase [Candidatus Thorarchaeota archaeon]